MPNQKDMTTAATAAGRLGVSSSDAKLPPLITAASSALAKYLRFPVHRRVGVVESTTGRGGDYLWLAAGAVQSIASIAVSGSVMDSSLYALDGDEGALEGRIIARGSYCWPFTGRWTAGVSPTPLQARDTGEIIVTFTSGWVTPGQVALGTFSPSDMPEELEQACLEAVTAWYTGAGKDARVTSVSTGDASMSWDAAQLQQPLPTLALALAGPYRKPLL